MYTACYSKLFCPENFEEKESREDMHPGLDANLNLVTPEWQPNVPSLMLKC